MENEYNINDASGLEDMLNGIDNNQQSANQQDDTSNTGDDDDKQDDQNTDPGNTDDQTGDDDSVTLTNEGDDQTDGDTDDSQTDDEAAKEAKRQEEINKQLDSQKAQHAFAAMRTQNKAMTGLLSQIAEALELTYTDEADMIAKLKDNALTKIAARTQVPKEMLERLRQSEERASEYERQQRYTTNMNSLNNIMSSYSLPKEQVVAFVQELANEQIDYRTTDIDLVKEFKARNIDLIVKMEKEKAVQEALKRDEAANKHSSKSKDSGKKQSGAAHKINSMSELDNAIKNLKS